MMLRLHGYPVSNYFNIARAALIEKQLCYQVVIARASQDEAFLEHSPMGKIPVLETSAGWLGETVAILEFLDDAYPDVPLRAADPFPRARGRQIINIVQMYVEAPTRALFPGVFFGETNDASTEKASSATLARATAALTRLMRPAPYILGDRPGQADLFAFYHLDLAERVAKFVYNRSLFDEIDGLGDWNTRMRERDSSRVVLADFEEHLKQYLVDRGAAYGTTRVAA
jgi:glutathione S-transferase